MSLRSPILFAVALSAGCAAPLGMARPATVIEPGHVRASVDFGLRSAQDASDMQEAARRQLYQHTGAECGDGDDTQVCPDDAARRAFVEGAAAGLLSSPQTGDSGLAVRYGVAPGVDAGVRLGTSAVRGEVALQVFGDPLNSVDSGFTALIGAGLSHQLSLGGQPVEFVELGDPGRDDLDLFALAGYRYYRKAYVSVGARYMGSYLRGTLTEVVPASEVGPSTDRRLPDTDISGLAHHVGVVVSAYAGMGAVYFGVEVAGGVDFTQIRALGEDRWVSASSFRPAIVALLEI